MSPEDPTTARTPIHHLEKVMGTVVSIELRPDPDTCGSAFLALARARATLQRADAVFSTWRPDSPMSRLRRGEISLEQAPAQVRTVLLKCEVARELTKGWFDPWAMPGGVDPTGLVKGWAADRALEEIIAGRIDAAMVNAAGDIATVGGPTPGQPWRIGVRDPASASRIAAIVEVTGAIATSGVYERGEHLIDPHTGRPTCLVASATVVGTELALADALATALAVAGETGLSFVAAAGFEGLVITEDGRLRATDSFPFARGAGDDLS